MQKLDLIAFSGPKGSGKSTAAEALRYTPFWTRYVRVSFAERIRKMLLALGVPRDNLVDPELKEIPLPEFGGWSARYLMQTLGTEWGRECVSHNIWLDVVAREIRIARAAGMPIIIDDARFDNELACVHDLGGVVIEIQRPGCVRGGHQSELGLDPALVDYAVKNDSTPENFAAAIRNLVSTL